MDPLRPATSNDFDIDHTTNTTQTLLNLEPGVPCTTYVKGKRELLSWDTAAVPHWIYRIIPTTSCMVLIR